MKHLKLYITILISVILLFAITENSKAQTKIDSLNSALEKKIAEDGVDTSIAGIYLKLYKETYATQPIISVQHAANALQIYTQFNDSNGVALTERYIGDNYFQRGIYNFAMDYYIKSFEIYTQLNNESEIAYSYLKIGQTYLAQKLGGISLESYQKSLAIFKKINSLEGISFAYDNMSKVKLMDYQFEEALLLLDSSLQIREEIGNNKLIALSYEAIAETYIFDEDYELAGEYFKKALVKYKLDNDIIKVADTYFGLGEIYLYDEMYDVSEQNYNKALLIYKENGRLMEVSSTQNKLGRIFLTKKRYFKAEKMAEKSLKTALTYNFNEIRLESYKLISDIYKAKGRNKESLKYLSLYVNLRDTFISEIQNKQSAELQVNLATQKKEQEIEILEKDKQIQKAKLKKNDAEQQVLIIGISTLVIFLVFTIIFGFYLFKSNKKVKKANTLLIDKNEEINKQKEEIQEASKSITEQKNVIEAKNIKINASLNYAGRMQRAMLPKISEIRKNLPDSFVMLSPKEAVSGDFFWHTVTKDKEGNEKIIITAVDCTGHGVPGAFMSMLGDAYLNQIVFHQNIVSPEKILYKLHEGIYTALQQDRSRNADGMDISICVIDKKNKKLEFAGAKNPIYFIQNNEEHIIKGNILSIGGFVKKERIYTKHTIDISDQTHFYIYSDGFQDQFGGKNNKKYMAKRFRNFLFEIHSLPMNEQAVALAVELDDWKGERDQMDDIIVIGVKL